MSYGRVEIDPNIPWNVGAVGIGARYAASALQGDLVDLSQTCPSTFTVIAGYSQGAWAVDKALRNMKNSANPSIRFSLANIAGVFLMGDPAWPRQGDRSGIATFFDQGYDTETDYLDNGLSTARFRSICLAYSGGQQDPICHYSPNADWKGEIPVHQQYAEGGVTQTGADWLAGLARSVGGAR